MHEKERGAVRKHVLSVLMDSSLGHLVQMCVIFILELWDISAGVATLATIGPIFP
jgi:hypothetical protein